MDRAQHPNHILVMAELFGFMQSKDSLTEVSQWPRVDKYPSDTIIIDRPGGNRYRITVTEEVNEKKS